MAYSADTKAEAVRDVITGRRTRAQVCRDLQCSSFTINEWLNAAKQIAAKNQTETKRQEIQKEPETKRKASKTKRSAKEEPNENQTVPEVDDGQYRPLIYNGPPSKIAFEESLYGFLMETNEMARQLTRTCSDPSFIRESPSAVNELARTIFEQRDRLLSSVPSATGQESPVADHPGGAG